MLNPSCAVQCSIADHCDDDDNGKSFHAGIKSLKLFGTQEVFVVNWINMKDFIC